MKKCSKCCIEKDFSFFYKSGENKYRSSCKDCDKKYRENNKDKLKNYWKEYYNDNKDKIKEYHDNYYSENKEYILESVEKYRGKNKEKIKESSKKYYESHKEQKKEYEKKYRIENKDKLKEKSKTKNNKNKEKRKGEYEKNKEQIKENQKKYYEENKEDIRKRNSVYKKNNRNYYNQYYRDKIINDSSFKAKESIRNLIKNAYKGYVKNSKTEDILGCSYEDFKLYIESKFESWMTWDNRGLYNGDFNYGWDIDHIIPLSSIDKNLSESEILMRLEELNHYTNLQPLCSKFNRHIKRNLIFS